jgi:alkylation response protein AidB-like acyl-CoA dehydrogenase
MDFGLSEDQVLFKDSVRRFLAEQCPTTRVRQTMESANGYDEKLQREVAELGITGLIVPPSHDGLGLELLDLSLVAEELGYAAAPGPFLASSLATVALAEGGDDTVRDRWLRGLASGEVVGTIAFGEDDSEWDPAHMKASVTGGKLTGRKPFVPYPDVADFMIVIAKDGDGPGFWAVERSAPGIQITPLQSYDLTRRVSIVDFKDTPAIPLPGREAVQRTIDAGLVLLAADGYGGARRCLEMTTSYALERVQFGQVIGAFQAVKHQLADMATDLEPAMSLYWYAAHAFDHIKDQFSRHAVMAKAHICDIYDRVVRDTTELHGGIGFTWEFDLHLWFRRSMFNRGFLGDSAFLRARAADLQGW